MSPTTVSTQQQRIAETARKYLQVTTLSHHINREWMEEAYRRTRKTGAVGTDNLTAEDFAKDLVDNIDTLVNLCKSGNYQAPPVRRAYIPKNAIECRPLGIPTFSDKVMQRAAVMLLEPIYEQDFYECSYGFRPGRSAHNCVKALWATLQKYRGGYILDIDIRKYFDTIPKGLLRDFVALRVQDGVMNRMIGKWLNAGVMEKGELSYQESGTPQGGVISPLLANIYLHYVLDDWFYNVALAHLDKPAQLFRYADDFVVVCKTRRDAERLLTALRQRFAKHGLTVHEGKSRLIDFSKPSEKDQADTFCFLGFNFYWGTTRKGGRGVMLKTAKDRFSRACRKLNELCQEIRHEPVAEQRKRINQSLRGHFNYYGMSFNSSRLWQLKFRATRTWYKWLKRRSQRRHLIWEKFLKIEAKLPLLNPKITVPLW